MMMVLQSSPSLASQWPRQDLPLTSTTTIPSVAGRVVVDATRWGGHLFAWMKGLIGSIERLAAFADDRLHQILDEQAYARTVLEIDLVVLGMLVALGNAKVWRCLNSCASVAIASTPIFHSYSLHGVGMLQQEPTFGLSASLLFVAISTAILDVLKWPGSGSLILGFFIGFYCWNRAGKEVFLDSQQWTENGSYEDPFIFAITAIGTMFSTWLLVRRPAVSLLLGPLVGGFLIAMAIPPLLHQEGFSDSIALLFARSEMPPTVFVCLALVMACVATMACLPKCLTGFLVLVVPAAGIVLKGELPQSLAATPTSPTLIWVFSFWLGACCQLLCHDRSGDENSGTRNISRSLSRLNSGDGQQRRSLGGAAGSCPLNDTMYLPLKEDDSPIGWRHGAAEQRDDTYKLELEPDNNSNSNSPSPHRVRPEEADLDKTQSPNEHEKEHDDDLIPQPVSPSSGQGRGRGRISLLDFEEEGGEGQGFESPGEDSPTKTGNPEIGEEKSPWPREREFDLDQFKLTVGDPGPAAETHNEDPHRSGSRRRSGQGSARDVVVPKERTWAE